MLLDIGFQLLALLDYQAADFGGQLALGQNHEVRLFDRYPETHQTFPSHAGAVGAGLVKWP
jgi:hypothetical protein